MRIDDLPASPDLPTGLRFLAGGGAATQLILQRDWAGHVLGLPELWPDILKTTLSTVLNSPESMLLAWGRDDLSFFFNEAYIPLLGPRLSRAMGAPFREVWADAWAQAKPIIDEAFAGRSQRFNDLPWKLDTDRGPADTWFTFSYSRVLNPEGEVVGLFVFTNETTSRVVADAALRESEEQLRLVVQGATDYAILTTDPTGRITTWSNGAERVLGWSAVEALGQSFSMIFTVEDREHGTDMRELETARRDGSAANERWHLTKSGAQVFLNGSVHPLPYDAQGAERGFLKVARNETERWKAQRALETLNETLEQQVAQRTEDRDRLWRLSSDIMLVASLEGVIELVNPAWTRVLGWAKGELIGRPIFNFIHPEDLEHTRGGAAGISQGEAYARFENRYRHKDGSYRDITWAAGPGDGKIIAVGRDTTEEKAQINALAAAQEQLAQSQKMEAVGQLTGGVAHDFNNLLTIIRSSVDFLKRPDLTPQRRDRYVTAIGDTVERAAKLTSQLLAFARRQPLQPEVFDISARVQAVSELVRPLMGARISVELEPCSRPCYTRADVSQFETALVNLAVNARDAMNGEGRLTLSVREVGQIPSIRGHAGARGDFLVVSVSDTGKGIEPGMIASIFEPFFTTKEVGKGTGLGLSQVFGFAKQTGGEVDVRSVLGSGSTFELYLPRVTSAVASTQPQISEEDSHSPPPNVRVLIVEDNEAVGRFAEEMLKDLGYGTDLVGNAAEALDRIVSDSQTYDAVFSDVIMPGMNGVEMANEIRRLRPDLPVVLTSGYSDVLAREGAHGFELLRKPYSIDELSRVLRRVVSSANGDGSSISR